MSELARSIEALAIATDYQAEELRRARQERAQERWERPEFKAELEARRRAPRKVDFGMFARAIPGLADLFRRVVPDDRYELSDKGATVACPCGGQPTAPVGIAAECDCDRMFLFTGASVRVAFSPLDAEEAHRSGPLAFPQEGDKH